MPPRLSHQALQQATLTASDVHHRPTTCCDHGFHHRGEPLIVEAQRPFESVFPGVQTLIPLIRIVRAISQPGQSVPSQGTEAEVSPGDQRSFRVSGEPVATASEQLVDLVLADPVVLLPVEHRQQHVQVGERISDR